MSRDLGTTISAAIEKRQLRPFWAVDLLFDSPNDLYFWSGLGSLTVDSLTYTGAGNLLQISDMRESSDIAAYGATLTLSGIPTSLITLAKSEPYHGRKARVKFGVMGFTESKAIAAGTGFPITIGDGTYIEASVPPYDTAVVSVFSGEMDQMNISQGPETATISLNIESRMIDLRRPRILRYSDSDQKSRFPNDRAFEFMNRLQTESLEWNG